MNRKIALLLVALSLLFVIGCKSDPPPKIETKSLYSDEQTAFINSVATKYNATFVSFDDDPGLSTPFYSLDLERRLMVGNQKPVAITCYLVDISRQGEKYFIAAGNSYFYPTIKYILDCPETIANLILQNRSSDGEVVIIATINNVGQPLLGTSINTPKDSESEININTSDNIFIAKGKCIAVENIPVSNGSK